MGYINPETTTVQEQINKLANRITVLEKKDSKLGAGDEPVTIIIDGHVIRFADGCGYSARGASSFQYADSYFHFYFADSSNGTAVYSPEQIVSIKAS